MAKEHIIICVGGGGTPTIYESNKLKRVDAVIDKDVGSALLANELHADNLIILTNIEGVYKNYGKENQELLSVLTFDEAQNLLDNNEFGEGSMAPKIRAALEFSKQGETIITTPDLILDALQGKKGTKILKKQCWWEKQDSKFVVP